MQPAIDALAIRAQQRCNRSQPVVINTYQARAFLALHPTAWDGVCLLLRSRRTPGRSRGGTGRLLKNPDPVRFLLEPSTSSTQLHARVSSICGGSCTTPSFTVPGVARQRYCEPSALSHLNRVLYPEMDGWMFVCAVLLEGRGGAPKEGHGARGGGGLGIRRQDGARRVHGGRTCARRGPRLRQPHPGHAAGHPRQL